MEKEWCNPWRIAAVAFVALGDVFVPLKLTVTSPSDIMLDFTAKALGFSDETDRDDEKFNAVLEESLPYRDEEPAQPPRSIVRVTLETVLLLLGVCYLLMTPGILIHVAGLQCSYSCASIQRC